MNAQPAPPAAMQARQQQLVQAIADHLAAHPQAADSADGVARWWLGMRGIHADAPEVELALAALVAQQRLRCTHLADGTALYSSIHPSGRV